MGVIDYIFCFNFYSRKEEEPKQWRAMKAPRKQETNANVDRCRNGIGHKRNEDPSVKTIEESSKSRVVPKYSIYTRCTS